MKRLILALALIAMPMSIQAQQPDPAAPAPAAAAATEQPAAPAAAPAAVGTPTPAPAPVAAAANTDTEEPEATVGDLISGTAKVVDDWKTLGWIAGLIALINLFTHLLRFKWLNDFLEAKDLKHIKPWIAAGFGAIAGGLTTFQTGAGVLNSVVAGLLAGFAAIGAHEVLSTKKRKAETEALKAAKS